MATLPRSLLHLEGKSGSRSRCAGGEHAPEPALFETWLNYVQSLLPRLADSARTELKATTLARAAAVAEAAAGEPYGVGRQVSPEERQVIHRIEAAFE